MKHRRLMKIRTKNTIWLPMIAVLTRVCHHTLRVISSFSAPRQVIRSFIHDSMRGFGTMARPSSKRWAPFVAHYADVGFTTLNLAAPARGSSGARQRGEQQSK